MRRIAFLLTLALVSGIVLAAGGDMGVGTDPNTNGSDDYPWLIEDFDDFDEFANNSAYWAAGVHTKLMTNIDLDPSLPGRKTYTAAVIAPDMDNSNLPWYFDGTPFRGVFDGNNCAVINLIIDTTAQNNTCLGLFGYIEGFSQGMYPIYYKAEVKNLGIKNITIIGNSPGVIGALTGINSGTITNCHSTGQLSGGLSIGGLVGENFGSIKDCYSNCMINATGSSSGGIIGENDGSGNGISISNCFANGEITGDTNVGGLIGWNRDAQINNCYACGTVNGDSCTGGLIGYNHWRYPNPDDVIANCYATATVNGNSDSGGFLGYNYETLGRIQSCYFLDTAGPDNGYADPLDDLNMMIRANFTGWDFVGETANGSEDIWRMCVDDVDYPRLWFEFGESDFVCGDGVDLVDFVYLASYWGLDCDTVDCGRADVDGSGDVGLGDLAAVAEDWLK